VSNLSVAMVTGRLRYCRSYRSLGFDAETTPVLTLIRSRKAGRRAGDMWACSAASTVQEVLAAVVYTASPKLRAYM